VVGITWGKRRIGPDRSLEGSLAFFGTTLAICIFVLSGSVVAPWTTLAGMSFTIAAAAAICELLPLRIDDNMTIPLVVGFATWVVGALFGVALS